MKRPIRLQLDPMEADYLRTTPPDRISFDGLHGNLVVKAAWTDDSASSSYRPSNDELTIERVALAVVLEELIAAARKVASGSKSIQNVVIHGTPLEFAVGRTDDAVTTSLVEAIGYSDEERVLGHISLTPTGFSALVAEMISEFVRQIVDASPVFGRDPGLRRLKQEAQTFLRRRS